MLVNHLFTYLVLHLLLSFAFLDFFCPGLKPSWRQGRRAAKDEEEDEDGPRSAWGIPRRAAALQKAQDWPRRAAKDEEEDGSGRAWGILPGQLFYSCLLIIYLHLLILTSYSHLPFFCPGLQPSWRDSYTTKEDSHAARKPPTSLPPSPATHHRVLIKWGRRVLKWCPG